MRGQEANAEREQPEAPESRSHRRPSFAKFVSPGATATTTVCFLMIDASGAGQAGAACSPQIAVNVVTSG